MEVSDQLQAMAWSWHGCEMKILYLPLPGIQSPGHLARSVVTILTEQSWLLKHLVALKT
jgi:hypothetical protein